MTLKKIISGGQTGADRAALDFAIDNDLSHGGWVPRGRLAEDGVIPDRYQVNETQSSAYAERTEKNVIDSDGTLIFSHGPLVGGSELTRKLAQRHGRPCLHMDLDGVDEFYAAFEIMHWLQRHGIEIVNVAGSRASKDPGIYYATFHILEAVYYFSVIEESMPDFINRPFDLGDPGVRKEAPSNLTEAVARLMEDLPLKERVAIAGLNEREFFDRHGALDIYIRNYFGLSAGNTRLLASCRDESGNHDLDIDGAVVMILKNFRSLVKTTHSLRVVKA
jgi:hypothetical protein